MIGGLPELAEKLSPDLFAEPLEALVASDPFEELFFLFIAKKS